MIYVVFMLKMRIFGGFMLPTLSTMTPNLSIRTPKCAQTTPSCSISDKINRINLDGITGFTFILIKWVRLGSFFSKKDLRPEALELRK